MEHEIDMQIHPGKPLKVHNRWTTRSDVQVKGIATISWILNSFSKVKK